ncbi:MAG: TetR/AcrR family transcriptional regulator [Isosphaeraceae bacterium]
MTEPEGTRREQQADATQAHVAQVAMSLFAEHGFSATSTRKIAQAAGVSEGLIFHHFGSKLGLLVGAARRAKVLSEHIVTAVTSGQDAPVEIQLREIARGFITFLRSDRLETRLFRVLMAEASTNPDLYALQQERTRLVTTVLAAYIRSRIETGELRPDLVPEAAAQVLLGSFLWYFLTHLHLTPEEWAEQAGVFADAVIDQWLRGARVEAS